MLNIGKRIGERIKMLRVQRGLTQSELGRKVKITQCKLSAMERGKRKITAEEFIMVADGLDVSIDALNPKKNVILELTAV